MKNRTLIGLTVVLLLVLSACSGGQESNNTTSQKVLGSAYITLEDVTVDVMEVSKIPTELQRNGSIQFFGGGNHLIDLQVSGNPKDHFVGSKLFSLMELYDDSGNRCDMNILSGSNDDVLVMDKIDVIEYVKCSANTQSIKFIFGTSTNEYLNSVGDKFNVAVQDVPSTKTLSVLREQSQKYAESARAYDESVAKGNNPIQALTDSFIAQDIASRSNAQSSVKNEVLNVPANTQVNNVTIGGTSVNLEGDILVKIKDKYPEVVPDGLVSAGEGAMMALYYGSKDNNKLFNIASDKVTLKDEVTAPLYNMVNTIFTDRSDIKTVSIGLSDSPTSDSLYVYVGITRTGFEKYKQTHSDFSGLVGAYTADKEWDIIIK